MLNTIYTYMLALKIEQTLGKLQLFLAHANAATQFNSESKNKLHTLYELDSYNCKGLILDSCYLFMI